MSGVAQKPQNQIFLSYSRNDRDAAVAMRSALEKQGLSVFHDEKSIHAGDNWMNRLQDTLQECSGFVLLVGQDGVQRWIGAEVQVALSRHLSPHEESERLPIYPVLLNNTSYDALPPFLSLFQITAWSVDTDIPQAFLETVKAGINIYDDQQSYEGCPFLGLNAFQRSDATLFFGRRLETLQALSGLGDQQQTNPEQIQGTANTVYHCWLQVEGNSGSGKSSLVNAGMLPMIEQGALWPRTGYNQWHIFEPMMPGRNPLEMLADTLGHKQKGLVEANRSLLAWTKELEADERALAYALREYRKDDTAFLLIIDQFEELFTFAEDNPRKAFDALLAYALQDPQCPLFVISTVRTDFLDRYELLTKLQGIYNQQCKRYFLPLISEQGLREIIQQPAKLAGLDVSDIREMIISDAAGEIGALPLVQNALHYLWEHRDNHKLSAQLYTSKGKLAGLLSTQADQLLNQLGSDKKYALKLLLRLTRINNEGHHTRRRISREEAIHVAGKGERGENIIRQLSGQRLLDGRNQQGALRLITVSEARYENHENGNGSQPDNPQNNGKANTAQRQVDLIHETLVRSRCIDKKTGKAVGYWPTLYDYIDDNRDNDMHLQQLQYQSENWQQSGVLGKWASLATGRERRQYKKLDIDKASKEGRYLFWSRWVRRLQVLILAFVLGVFGHSLWWANKNNLPFGYAFLKPLWHLGYMHEPEMVEVPAGSFRMGCVSGKSCDEDELPVHNVAVTKPFLMGKYEVTFLQYDRYVWEKQNNGNTEVEYPGDSGFGRYDRPVILVTLHDVKAYIHWLNKKTSKEYRLPSEAEWEYSARAGTESRFYTGDCITSKQANFSDSSQWDREEVCQPSGKNLEKTSIVGSYPANAFQLHDMHGNVWEWVEDKYHASYEQAPVDGSQWKTSQDKNRVLRGGSWVRNGRFLRSAYREGYAPVFRNVDVGFRLSQVKP